MMDLSGRPASFGRPHLPSRGSRRTWPRAFGFMVALLFVGAPQGALGQGYRGWTSTSAHVIELRPVGVDTVPRADVVTDSSGRFFYDGLEVTCVLATECTGYVTRPKERTLAVTQDLGLTAWGFGVEGLSVTALVRARGRAGGQLVWPRSDDELDALLGYAQLQKGDFRVRAGRQDIGSGLGFTGFDGVSAMYSRGSLSGELYGGRSLARGLREPANQALRGLDDFFVDKSAILLGGSVSGRAFGVSATGRYEREILTDRSSLVGERASLDVSKAFPRVRVVGSMDYDFSFERVGKSRLTFTAPLRGGLWLAELSAQRYVPYFDLSTLWGFFEPVSYHEVVGRVGWSPGSALAAWVSGGWRKYGDTQTAIVLQPMRDTGWRADAGARWRATPTWELDGRYQLEWGPGGFLSTVDAAVRYDATERLSASLSALSFQQIEEYRLGQGRAFGLGASADFAWNERVSVGAGFSLVRHRDGGNAFTSPWNQGRAWTTLRFELGQEPGLANRGTSR